MPSYYADIVKAPLSFSVKYYVVYMFLFSIIVSAIIVVRWVIPISHFALQDLPPLLVNVYPEELVVTINNGQVSTNVQEPYFIPVSRLEPIGEAFKQRVLGSQESDVQNLLVIDTEATAEDITSYNTLILLTWDAVSFINDSGNIETMSLKKVENITINQETINKSIESITPLFAYITPVATLILIIGLFCYGFIRLTYIAFLAFLLWILSLIMKVSLPYKKTFQIELHANLIPFTILTLIGLSGLMVPIPYLELIINIILAVIILVVIKPLPPKPAPLSNEENTKNPA
jgi:hypothetical protein